MTAREAKSQYLLKEWVERISECSRSGMSTKAWCAANDINERKYYYWLRKAREYAAQFMPANYSKAEISESPAVAPKGRALVKADTEMTPPRVYSEERALPKAESKEGTPTGCGAVAVEIGRFRVLAAADANEEALTKVLRTLVSIC